MIELDNKPQENPFKQLSLKDIDKFTRNIRRYNQETRIFITKVEKELDNHHK